MAVVAVKMNVWWRRGAKVAGQREWGWVTQELGIPNFPQDFPDCQAAADLAKLLAADLVSSASVDHAVLESFLAAPL